MTQHFEIEDDLGTAPLGQVFVAIEPASGDGRQGGVVQPTERSSSSDRPPDDSDDEPPVVAQDLHALKPKKSRGVLLAASVATGVILVIGLGWIGFGHPDLEGSLFGTPGDSEVDQALMESIHEDLDSIDFDNDPKGDETIDSIFGANPLTGDANPLLNSGHRKRWLSTAIAGVGYNKVDKHLKQQAKAIKAVKAEMRHIGVATDAISGFWLGYEPPQISPEIAKAYRIDETVGDLQRNQSVMLVAFR